MKQTELRKFIRKQGAKLDRHCMRVLPFYKFHDDKMHISGTSTNEKKSALIKSGYDIICPNCGRHWGEGTFEFSTKCVCRYSWRTNLRGCPKPV